MNKWKLLTNNLKCYVKWLNIITNLVDYALFPGGNIFDSPQLTQINKDERKRINAWRIFRFCGKRKRLCGLWRILQSYVESQRKWEYALALILCRIFSNGTSAPKLSKAALFWFWDVSCSVIENRLKVFKASEKMNVNKTC